MSRTISSNTAVLKGRAGDECARLQLVVVVQGDSADSMLSWVVEQQGQEAMKDPNLAKQVTLAVLRQAIPNPKVELPPPRHAPLPSSPHPTVHTRPFGGGKSTSALCTADADMTLQCVSSRGDCLLANYLLANSLMQSLQQHVLLIMG